MRPPSGWLRPRATHRERSGGRREQRYGSSVAVSSRQRFSTASFLLGYFQPNHRRAIFALDALHQPRPAPPKDDVPILRGLLQIRDLVVAAREPKRDAPKRIAGTPDHDGELDRRDTIQTSRAKVGGLTEFDGLTTPSRSPAGSELPGRNRARSGRTISSRRHRHPSFSTRCPRSERSCGVAGFRESRFGEAEPDDGGF
jgi:hypothetical protein